MVYLRKIFDAHVHFRQGKMLFDIMGLAAKYCFAAVAMGNTVPPYSADNVRQNRKTIKEAATKHGNKSFNPIMTIMMTVGINKEDVKKAFDNGARVIKLIPGDTSTGSKGMVALKDLRKYYDILAYAAGLGMKFSIHCELVFDPASGREIPMMEREKAGIPYLDKLVKSAAGLEIIVEHISSKIMLDYVLSVPERVMGTITTHHLFGHYNMACDEKGEIISPENYCLPILKPMRNMYALRHAVLAGPKKLFFGSDLAPHPPASKDLKLLKGKKPKAGIFCPYEIAIPLIWDFFSKNLGKGKNSIRRFNDFMSGYGSAAYGLEPSHDLIKLVQKKWTTKKTMANMPVFWGGRELEWQIEE